MRLLLKTVLVAMAVAPHAIYIEYIHSPRACQTFRGGGWSVIIKLGNAEKPLGTQRTNKPRLWRRLDRCIEYLKNELHIARFDLRDATNYDNAAVGGKARVDTAERMRRTHEAAVHDKWFREQVEQGDQIEHQVSRLINRAEMGRRGRIKGTRELVIGRTPFIVVYRIKPGAGRIESMRVLHGSQQRPPTA